MPKVHEVPAHADGLCDMNIHPTTGDVFTCGSDGNFRCFSLPALEIDDDKTAELDNALNAIAFHSDGQRFVVGGSDNEVTMFTHPACTKESFLVRFTGAVCDLDFHPRGLSVACGADDETVKVVSTYDDTQVTRLPDHAGGCKTVSFDPEGCFLATVDCLGTLRLFNTNDYTIEKTSKELFPRSDVTNDQLMNRLAWHPTGNQLALPGKHEVRLLQRGTWELETELKGAHSDLVSLVAYSPNGLYLASAGRDHKIYVWDLAKKDTIGFTDVQGHVTSMRWCPGENALVFISSSEGTLCKWSTPVPSHSKSCFEAVGETEAAASDGDPVVKEEAEGDAATSAPVKMEATKTETAEEEGEPAGESYDLEPTVYDLDGVTTTQGSDSEEDELDKYNDDDEVSQRKMKRLRRASHQPEPEYYDEYEEDEEDAFGSVKEQVNKMFAPQAAFQPGSTPMAESKRLLVWNELGCIISRDETTHHGVEIQYSDNEKRPVRMRDHYHFTMAALGPNGAVFASRRRDIKDEKTKKNSTIESTIFYQPTQSWAPGDWTLHLEAGEQAVAVAIGSTWAAVATDTQYLRIFSYSGVQRHVVSLDGPVVCMTGSGDKLAVVYHRGLAMPGNQNLGLIVFDVDKHKKVQTESVALTPRSELTWLSYSDSNLLLTKDSAGVVRCLSKHLNGWAPILDLAAYKREFQKSGTYWPVSMVEDKLMVAICKSSRKPYPKTTLPLLTDMDLKMPFLNTGKDSAKKEELMARNTLLLHERTTVLTIKQRQKLDKEVILLMKSAIQQDKTVRALDLATSLRTVKSLEIAVTLANHMKKPHLAERLNILLQALRRASMKRAAPAPQSQDNTKENIQAVPQTLDLSPTATSATKALAMSDTPNPSSTSKLVGRRRLQKRNADAQPKQKKAKSSTFASNLGGSAKKKSNPFAM